MGNYDFLKNIKPELYKLCLKMEEDLIITPVSMLAYSTRFLEYILYDIAKSKGYKVNTEIGFVKNIYELIQLNFIDFYFGDLLIKAYVFRNSSIHNTDVIKAIKDDKKTALELNKRLFDIADIFYGDSENDYVEPKFSNGMEKNFIHILKQHKSFDNCIICGKSTIKSKSNFCQECDNLLNYREVISEFISKNGKNTFFKFSDLNYSEKTQMFNDLISRNIIEKVGNNYHFLANNLDEYFILTDYFMEIDDFLVNFINDDITNPIEYEMYGINEYPFEQVPIIVTDYYVGELIDYLKDGYSLEYSLQRVDITKSKLNSWYNSKKSEFIGGFKDNLFIEFNELLIKDYFKSIEKNEPKEISYIDVNFLSEYFDGFSDKYIKRLGKYKLKLTIDLLKMRYTKKDILNQLAITEEDLNQYLSIHKILADDYWDEINSRKNLFLKYVKDLSLNESLEKSKLTIDDIKKDREEFFNGNENEFYQELTQILMNRYLMDRSIGLSTDEICSNLTIEKSEIDLWIDNDFADFQDEYNKIQLILFKKAISNEKSKTEILNDLEITEEELNEYIELGRQGVKQYTEYYDIFNNDYYPNLIKMFLKEFETSTLNSALNKYDLTKEDLNKYFNEDSYNKFIEIKISKLVNRFIDKGKINKKFLDKLDLSKNEYSELKEDVDKKIMEKQLILLSDYISDGMITYYACIKVHCDLNICFDWILKGSLCENSFSELALAYWEENLLYINDANSDLRDKISERVVRKNFKPKVRYDYDYWKKWGLISKKHVSLEKDDVKTILKKFNDVN